MTYHARELLRIPNFEGEEESCSKEFLEGQIVSILHYSFITIIRPIVSQTKG